MKFTACLLFCLTALAVSPASAQTPPPPPASAVAERGLTKFDLDFPGGTPGELVAAIQKAMGKPLNVIIPNYYADHRLPALKMSGVDVMHLFAALSSATQHTILDYVRNYSGNSQMGFRCVGDPLDGSVWYFYVDEPPAPPQSSRFYLLSSYLDRGLTVDDITTAIQTAWKMNGDGGNVPKMSFHKETKLLIAAGDSYRLETIDKVLKALDGPEPKAAAPAPKSAAVEEKKP